MREHRVSLPPGRGCGLDCRMLPAPVRHAYCVSLFALFGAISIAASQNSGPSPTQTFHLQKIEATGLSRYTAADIVKVSGLAIGQSVTTKDLEASAAKLSASGLFTSVRFRYAFSGDQMSVTFELGEITWGVPVVYDNLVWFTDAELTAAIRAEVPSYDGTAPVGGAVTETISEALGHLLQTRGLPGTIDYKPSIKVDGSDRRHLYRVQNPAVKTCTLHFDGASAVSERDLLDAARTLVGVDFSRREIEEYSRLTLIQLYRQKGFWRASFVRPTTVLANAAGCDGVTATVHVDEGEKYTWDRAEWAGNSAIDARLLDTLLAFRAGEVADSAKLQHGLELVRRAYGKIGHLRQAASLEPILDDAAKRAMFRIAISEGPEFHMGTLSFTGLPAKDAEALVKEWKLKPGDVYDDTLLNTFSFDVVRSRIAPRVAAPLVTATSAAVVNIVIDVK